MTEEHIRFRQIADELRNEFLKPEWKVGMELQLEPELMKRFSAGRNTIRSAIKQLMGEGMIARHHTKCCILVRKPSDPKKFRAGTNFGIIGSPEILDSSKTDIPVIASGLIDSLQKYDATLTLFPYCSKNKPSAGELVASLKNKNIVDGIFVSAVFEELKATCKELKNSGVPFIIFHASDLIVVQEKILSGIPSLHISELEEITNFFRAKKKAGMRRIILGGSPEDFIHTRTDFLCRKAAAAARLDYLSIHLIRHDFTEIAEIVQKYSDGQTMLVFSNRSAAILSVVYELIPDDARQKSDIVLFRHYAPDWSGYRSTFTIIERPLYDLGVRAADLMYSTYCSGNQTGKSNMNLHTSISFPEK